MWDSINSNFIYGASESQKLVLAGAPNGQIRNYFPLLLRLRQQ